MIFYRVPSTTSDQALGAVTTRSQVGADWAAFTIDARKAEPTEDATSGVVVAEISYFLDGMTLRVGHVRAGVSVPWLEPLVKIAAGMLFFLDENT